MAKKESPSKRMYKNSPRIVHDEEGKTKVSRETKEAKEEKMQAATEGVEENGSPDGSLPIPARHAMERREMANRHETEHSMHKGDKKAMHDRHEKESKEMHSRHEKEMTAPGSSGNAETKPEKGNQGESGDEKGNEKEKSAKVVKDGKKDKE